MKKFRWIWLTPIGTETKFASLMEIKDTEPDGRMIVNIVGNVVIDGKFYRPLVSMQTVAEDILVFTDAKEAVEKKLFDDGVIADGDIVEDRTE